MEVKYRTGNGQMEVNFDCKDQQSLFEEIASFQEVFEHNGDYLINGETVPSSDVQFRVRKVADAQGKVNDFYEKVYVGSNKNCWGFKFAYGSSQKDKGSLFPKYKNDGDNLVDGGGGWYKYTGGKSNDAPATDADNAGKPAKQVKGKTDKAPF